MRVLVTGGGTGIGAGVAAAARARGLEVVLCGRRVAPLRATAAIVGADVVVGDVTGDPASILEAAGPVDGLVHCAGAYVHAHLGTWAAEDFAGQFAVHVTGPALLSQAFAARLAGPGAVVFVGSTLGARPAPGAAAYAAAKAAQASLCHSLAQTLASRGVRVNAVLPGVVPTDMTRAPRDGLPVEAQLEALRALHPLGRLGTPADVGEAVAFLLCAPWITGVTLPVDGGLLGA
jgi:NAD(P)-dependent dehydrogenase (short-subunit alcohol dehydrogenase family)